MKHFGMTWPMFGLEPAIPVLRYVWRIGAFKDPAAASIWAAREPMLLTKQAKWPQNICFA